MLGFKKYIAKLLVIYVVFSNTFPATAYASQPVNSVLVPPAAIEQSIPLQEVQPVVALPQHSGKLSADASILALASNDGTRRSAHIRRGVSVQKLLKKDFKADEDVTLTLNNPDQEGYKTKIVDATGKEAKVQIQEEVQDGITELQVIPTNQFTPGKYTISVTDAIGKTTKQDFSWGVLALNPDQAVYAPNKTANIAMAVLDDRGAMVCDADVTLEVRNQELGVSERLSTENKRITVNPECTSHAFTLKPDYEASYQLGGVGTYDLTLTAKTGKGSHTITDQIVVSESTPFVIQRKSATRIYPPNVYPMELNITANRDFTGTITETVPASFAVTPADGNKSYDALKTVYLNNNDPTATLSQQVLGASTGGLVMPFDGNYPVTQGFGTQLTDPQLQAFYSHYGLGGHDGIDFGLPIGTPLYAVDDGKVVWSGPGDYGTQIVIQHSWGKTYYGHMSKTSVEKDVDVKKGSLIGYSGMTGEATGPHLHFGMKPDKADMSNGYAGKVDPMPFLPIGAGSNAAAALQQAGFNSVLGASTSAEAATPTPVIANPTGEAISSNSAGIATSSATPSSSSADRRNDGTTFTIEDAVSQQSAENQPQTMAKSKVLKWHVSLKKGDNIKLSYNYKTPQISPQFYLMGSLKFYEDKSSSWAAPGSLTRSKTDSGLSQNDGGQATIAFDEGRQWQLAADDIGTGWYHTNGNQGYEWPYRKKLTIDYTKVAQNVATPAFTTATVNSGASVGTVTTVKGQYTTTSQANSYLLVSTSIQATTAGSYVSVTGVTFNTTAGNIVSLTKLTAGNTTSNATGEIWYLKDPAVGLGNVNVTTNKTSTRPWALATVQVYNVDGTTPFDTVTTNTGNSATSVVPITATTDQIVLSFAAFTNTGSWTSHGTGQTNLWHDNVDENTAGSWKAGTGSSMNVNETFSIAQFWVAFAVPINPVRTDLTDFPVLVSSTDTDLKNHAQTDADDILFTNSTGAGTKLSHEIESYDNTTGALVAWVEIPNLSSSSDTDIYMYYGNPSIAAQEDPTNVWDSNFKGVWHFNENPAGSAPQMQESTSNNRDGTSAGTMTSGDLVAGEIGNGLDFDGADDTINVGSASDIDNLNPITASMWMNARTLGESSLGRLFDKANNTEPNVGWEINLLTTNTVGFYVGYNGTTNHVDREASNNAFTTNAWHMVTITWVETIVTTSQASAATIYIDGAAVASYKSTVNGTTPRDLDDAESLLIGSDKSGARSFNGIIDEVRLSNTVRSSGWISTEYNNQDNPGTFMSVSSEEGKVYSATADQYMRHGKFFDTSGNNYGIQPFMF